MTVLPIDTTIYQASKPAELTSCFTSVQRNVDKPYNVGQTKQT